MTAPCSARQAEAAAQAAAIGLDLSSHEGGIELATRAGARAGRRAVLAGFALLGALSLLGLTDVRLVELGAAVAMDLTIAVLLGHALWVAERRGGRGIVTPVHASLQIGRSSGSAAGGKRLPGCAIVTDGRRIEDARVRAVQARIVETSTPEHTVYRLYLILESEIVLVASAKDRTALLAVGAALRRACGLPAPEAEQPAEIAETPGERAAFRLGYALFVLLLVPSWGAVVAPAWATAAAAAATVPLYWLVAVGAGRWLRRPLERWAHAQFGECLAPST
ncbi:MAG: hypothetical protein HY744_34535 [Deltaproteobacteria bacterium]|nr:hypothetical protein [Deltaproteobacteria bacterium]